MTEDILEGLLDSKIKVRLLKLFLRNPEKQFTLDEICERIQTDSSSTRYQLRKLRAVEFLSSSLEQLDEEEEETHASRTKRPTRKRRVHQLNKNFFFYDEVRALVLKSSPIGKEMVRKEMGPLGKVDYLMLSGVFLDNPNARTDLLMVADNIDSNKFYRFIKSLESDVGREVRYTLMAKDEYKYRWSMFDNFVRALHEEPHEVVVDQLGDDVH